MILTVNEIFYSIQGESSYAGRPCVFVRLTGCNLRCAYCDTQYAYTEGKPIDIGDIVNQVTAFGCSLVEVTGGEPLMQENTPDLIRMLIEKGLTVLLETNGSMDISMVDARCIRIMDVKCPGSREQDQHDPENLNRLTDQDEVKFVISDRADYEFARKTAAGLAGKPNPVYFSPVFGQIQPDLLVEWILQDRLNVRMQLQLHKYIWHPDQRGV